MANSAAVQAPNSPTRTADPVRAGAGWERLAAPALILATLALRLIGFGEESLWYDETFSAYLASQPLPQLVAHTARDTHPPAYYALLHAWTQLTRPTVGFGFEYLLAWPSLWFSLIASALAYPLARRAYGPQAGLVALLLAGLHPFMLWSAHEVRMYAPAAALAMLTLWTMWATISPGQHHRTGGSPVRRRAALAGYVLAALAGLYTLYYMAFWLLTLNVAAIILIWRKRRTQSPIEIASTLRYWLIGQAVIVVGYLPWLPTFIRQTFDPAVAAWRTPFSGTQEILAAITQAFGALLVAHTENRGLSVLAFVTLMVMIALFIYDVYDIYDAKVPNRNATTTFTLLLVLPIVLMLAVSIAGPPIYHVRYVALSATITPLLVAGLSHSLPRRTAAVALLAITIAIQGTAIILLHTDPVHARDDHRAAVTHLAADWRPGDAILVNAGWAYTALSVYWPREPQSAYSARPPQLLPPTRLNEPDIAAMAPSLDAQPRLILAGSVDGPPSLGWGQPNSDHFALSASATLAGLERTAFHHTRIWHYRMYDTVSDPQQVIRARLTTLGHVGFQTPIPGPSFGLLERYDPSPSLPPAATALLSPSCCGFRERPPGSPLEPDTVLTVESVVSADTIPAGETLYVAITYRVESGSTPVSLSVRLHDKAQRLVAQSDEPLPIFAGLTLQHIMALAIPAGASPTDHHMSLVIYDPATLQPLDVSSTGPLTLAPVRVQLPHAYPAQRTTLARFDYLTLESAQWPSTSHRPGDRVELSLVWRPHASAYRDDYTVTLSLVPRGGTPQWAAPQALAVVSHPLSTPDYPSSRWEPGHPLIQVIALNLPTDLTPREYAIHLHMQRTSDGLPIPARQGWWPGTQSNAHLGVLRVGD